MKTKCNGAPYIVCGKKCRSGLIWFGIWVICAAIICFSVWMSSREGFFELRLLEDSHVDLTPVRKNLILIMVLKTSLGVTSFSLVELLLVFFVSKSSFMLTDNYIYTRTAFGKIFCICLNEVTEAGKAWPKGIYVKTHTGRYSFLLYRNSEELKNTICKIIEEKEQNVSASYNIESESPQYTHETW